MTHNGPACEASSTCGRKDLKSYEEQIGWSGFPSGCLLGSAGEAICGAFERR